MSLAWAAAHLPWPPDVPWCRGTCELADRWAARGQPPPFCTLTLHKQSPVTPPRPASRGSHGWARCPRGGCSAPTPPPPRAGHQPECKSRVRWLGRAPASRTRGARVQVPVAARSPGDTHPEPILARRPAHPSARVTAVRMCAAQSPSGPRLPRDRPGRARSPLLQLGQRTLGHMKDLTFLADF